jgi:hypothetical protein
MENSGDQNQPEGDWREQAAARRRERYIDAAKKQKEKGRRRSEFFAKTPLGKWWIPKKEELRKTPQGKAVLLVVLLLQIGGYILVGALLLFASTTAIDTYLFPADYNLTKAQQDEGYTRTWSDGYKSSSPESVYFRYYNETDYSTDQTCKADQDWCIYAIARNKGCYEIYMEFTTRATDGDSSPILENLTASKIAPNGEEYLMGERVTLGVVSIDPKAEYGQVEHIYCRGKG